MKKKNKSCPNCKRGLRERLTIFIKPPGGVIQEIDVTGRNMVELRGYGASGVALISGETNVEESLKKTTGIAYLKKELYCRSCSFTKLVEWSRNPWENN